MKFLITIARILVGLLFIFSGLVKANDPHGLSYKMQEFFEIWGVHQFNSWTLWLSILMNAFEIIAGFALLLGWRIRLFIWLLLLLILFFTFLTGYTYITGKPANCGCFGDCIPITSKTSFLKDLLLTALIGFLFWQQRKIKALFTGKANNIAMLLVIAFSFGIQWYTLNYLPVIDCLPYKKGNNINQQMQMPANAIPDSTVITFVYKKDGKDVEFTADQFPEDFNTPPYEFVKRYDKIVRKGSNNTPPIKGFSLSGITNEDSTQFVLSRPYAILLFCEDFSVPVSDWQKDFEKLYTEAKAKNIPVFAVTRQLEEARQRLGTASFKDISIFKCDFTAIRTAARSNPSVYLLENGTVKNKQSYRRISKISEDLRRIAVQPVILPIGIDTLQSRDTTNQPPVISNQ
ncbi:MAG: DoxX family protein [Chitinophagaceae bacterium]|nr:DoxX family protein [Chitinophagaceae bacterium]